MTREKPEDRQATSRVVGARGRWGIPEGILLEGGVPHNITAYTTSGKLLWEVYTLIWWRQRQRKLVPHSNHDHRTADSGKLTDMRRSRVRKKEKVGWSKLLRELLVLVAKCRVQSSMSDCQWWTTDTTEDADGDCLMKLQGAFSSSDFSLHHSTTYLRYFFHRNCCC